MALASTVRFSKDATSYDINGPAEPQDVAELPQWVTALTADGTRFVYRKNSTTISQWTIRLKDLTTTMKANLRSFYITNAVGPENTFTYRHTDGTTYTARFLDPAVPTFTRNNNDSWDVTIRLEISAQIAS